MADFDYQIHDDDDIIDLYVNGDFVTEWVFLDDPEWLFEEFKKVFRLGQAEAINELAEKMAGAYKTGLMQTPEEEAERIIKMIRNYGATCYGDGRKNE